MAVANWIMGRTEAFLSFQLGNNIIAAHRSDFWSRRVGDNIVLAGINTVSYGIVTVYTLLYTSI